MEEIELQWRMQLAGYRILSVPTSTVYHLGGGTLPVSSFKIYLNHRNNLAMLFKCSSTMQRLTVALVRPLTDAAEALSYLFTLHPHRAWAVVRAWATFLRWHPRLARERRAIIRRKKPEGIYRFSVVVRYLFGWRKFNTMI